MAGIHFVVDSTSRVPAAMLAAHDNIHVVSLKIIYGREEYPETALDAAAVFRLSGEHHQHPRTSQPSPGDFMAVLEPLAAAGQSVIVLTLAGGLSGTFQGAQAVTRQLAGANIYVVDSQSVAGGMVSLLQAGLTLAENNLEAGAIAVRLRQMAEKSQAIFMAGTLQYLHKGGRIGGAAALVGSILQIKPLLYLGRDGRVGVLDKVRTQGRALARLADELNRYSGLGFISVAYIGMEEEAQAMKALLGERFPGVAVTLEELGPVLATHLGPKVLGIIYREQ